MSTAVRPRSVPKPEFAAKLFRDLWEPTHIMDFMNEVDGGADLTGNATQREAEIICRSMRAHEIRHVVSTLLADETLWMNGGDDGTIPSDRVRQVLLEEWYSINAHLRGHVDEKNIATDVQIARVCKYVDAMIHQGIIGLRPSESPGAA